MSQGIRLSKKISLKIQEERERMNSIPYASTMESIIYAILCTRPDVAYVLGIASRFQGNLKE